MKTFEMTITPAVAKEWLDKHNINNRTIRVEHVKDLAKEMTDGRWLLTHQSVAFSESGRLLDGQHRLMAVVMSGVTVQMMVTIGAPNSSFVALDVGARRSHADLIGGGWTNDRTAIVLAAIMVVHSAGGTGRGSFPPSIVLDWASRLKGHIDILDSYSTKRKKIITTSGTCVGVIAAASIFGWDHVGPLWKSLSLKEYENLPPSLCGYVRFCETVHSITREVKMEMAVKARRAFDPLYQNTPKMVVKELSVRVSALAKELIAIVGEDAPTYQGREIPIALASRSK